MSQHALTPGAGTRHGAGEIAGVRSTTPAAPHGPGSEHLEGGVRLLDTFDGAGGSIVVQGHYDGAECHRSVGQFVGSKCGDVLAAQQCREVSRVESATGETEPPRHSHLGDISGTAGKHVPAKGRVVGVGAQHRGDLPVDGSRERRLLPSGLAVEVDGNRAG